MAIDYINISKEMTLECDSCGYTEEIEGSFDDCIQESKDRDWIFKPGLKSGEWLHFCSPKCRTAFDFEGE